MAITIKQSNLRRQFLMYSIKMAISLVMLVLLFVSIHQFAINSGFITPANYDEQRVIQAEPIIQEVDDISEISEDIIPSGIKYGIFSKSDLHYIAGDVELDQSTVSALLQSKTKVSSKAQQVYRLIETKQQYVVLSYELRSQFSSPVLRQWLPNVEILEYVIALAFILLVVFSITMIYVNRFKQHFRIISKLTRQIQKQDLDFEDVHSNIQEFDEIIQSLSEMRDALKQSLESQWKVEQTKNEQIAALAHDVKLPVTVIKGNAELLNLTELNEEQSSYTNYILEANIKIERYISLLIHMSRSQDILSIHKSHVHLDEWMQRIRTETIAYIGGRDIKIVMEQVNETELTHKTQDMQKTQSSPLAQPSLLIDLDLFHRAMMNILSNAVDHTPDGGNIILHTRIGEGQLIITITDSGEGFTTEALEQATQLFYMGDKSRSSQGHYGMGLTFAHNIIQLHGGKLTLRNATSGGGQVVIQIQV